MAYLLSISFTTPFCYRKPQFQGMYTRRLTCGLINPVTSRTGKKHLLQNNSGGGMISSDESCYCDIYAPTRRDLEPILCYFSVSSSIRVPITGFWMGPDVEDGWGFVEAFVHRI